MLNKISNLKLVLGLVVLGLVYLAVVYFDSPKSEELEKQLVSFDTAKVTGITITATDETVDLTRENQQWLVKLKSGKQVPAVTSKVEALLDQLSRISPDRLAAKDKSKWSDYQVDSTGTRVKVLESGTTTLDMIVGKSGSSGYVRLAEDVEVYASDGFSGLNNRSSIDHYRDNLFISMKTDSLTSISFNYPGDSSFQLVANGNKWQFDDGSAADSAKTVNYLNLLKSKNNDNFADQDGSAVGARLGEIVINSENQAQVTLTAFSDAADSVVYHSSLNQDAYFKDPDLGAEYFVSRSSLAE